MELQPLSWETYLFSLTYGNIKLGNVAIVYVRVVELLRAQMSAVALNNSQLISVIYIDAPPRFGH